MTLTEFLDARLVEDETDPRGLGPIALEVDAMGAPTGRHIVPARILAEVAAKRSIVQTHCQDDVDPCLSADHLGFLSPPDQCPVLRALASVYDNHPDYRQEWSDA